LAKEIKKNAKMKLGKAPNKLKTAKKLFCRTAKTIKSKINQYFYDKMENDLKYIQKNSKLYYTNNNLKNLECSNLLTNIINLAPKRFSKMNKNKINSLPFIKNDTIYFYILLNYNNIIKKFYKIIITLV
jgi:hypothetical protein